MSPEMIGYAALGLGVVALGMKRMVPLRVIHTCSAITYIVYGSLIDATPIIIAGSVSVIIHGFHLIRLQKKNNT